MNFFNYDNPFIRGVGKFFDLIFLSIIWCLCSATIVGMGAATTALYYTVVKVVRRDRSYLGKEFFRAFRMNFFPALLVEAVLLLFSYAEYVIDFPYIAELFVQGHSSNLLLLIFAIGKIYILIELFLYVFPILSRFHIGVVKALVTSFFLSIKHFFSSFIMLIVSVLICFIILLFPYSLVLLPGIFAFFCSYPMEWIMEKYILPVDKDDVTKDKWYLEES